MGEQHHFRFHAPHAHLDSPFGSDAFGQKAEDFARFFGTPRYLLLQSVLVAVWIVLNSVGVLTVDPIPFILLNLIFSTQAAYAAPMILLAQTRQSDRDKAHADADAQHREAIAQSQLRMLEQNTDLTKQVADLARQIETLTREIHGKLTTG
jgi:uncharacterized membrane protein